MDCQAGDITTLLTRWRQGDVTAYEHLVPIVHRELLRLARQRLGREGHRNSVQPSSLVQETYLRLWPSCDVDWRSRAHFFAVASEVMRRVLEDHARERNRAKRGGTALHIPAQTTVILSPEQLDEVIALDLALEQLAQKDQRKSKVFEMRFFGGLSVEETAEALGISPNTVIRDWDFARAWLRRELESQTVTQHGTLAKG